MNKKNKNIMTFGEIMLRLSPSSYRERIVQARDFTVEPGGSEANVAIALSLLGNRVGFITKLPDGILSDKIIRYLKSYSVDTSNIIFGGERLGLYWTEIGRGTMPSQVIYDREGSTFSDISYAEFDWSAVFKNTDWLHVSGITPAVSERACDTTMKVLHTAAKKAMVSIDLNFRGKLWKWAKKRDHFVHKAMKQICTDAYLITGNETDFFDCLGIGNGKEKSLDDYQKVAIRCFDDFPKLKCIGISLRESVSASDNNWSGVLFSKKNGKVIMHKGLQFRISNIVDRVGTGDSFTAGLIHGIINHDNDLQHVIDFAVALSALNHSVYGDASQFKAADVEHLLKKPGGRIIR